jgi:hypothetical protein
MMPAVEKMNFITLNELDVGYVTVWNPRKQVSDTAYPVQTETIR